jgi:cobalt-zinc-cadmium efflux system membrane fusion protein
LLITTGGFFTGCRKSNSPAVSHEHENHTLNTAADEHEDQHHNQTNGLRYLHIKPEFITEWNIRCAAPESREFAAKITLNGVVQDNKDTTYMVNTTVRGIVTRIDKDTGDNVRKGDTLCVLNSPELLEIKTNYIKTFQEYQLKQENFDRAKNLLKMKALEKKEYSTRESEYKTAMADFFSLEAQLNTVGFGNPFLQSVKEAVLNDNSEQVKSFLSPLYNVLSPSSGKVIMREINLGELLENNKKIYEISDTRKLWVLLDAMEKDLQYITKGKAISVAADSYPQQYFPGLITIMDEKLDPGLRTIKIRAEVDNTSGRLKPGMYVKGFIETKTKETHLAVPTTALVKLSGIDGVFAADEEDFFFKPLEIIHLDDNGWAFVKGLKSSDKIVVEGAFYLKAESSMQGVEDAHGHGKGE